MCRPVTLLDDCLVYEKFSDSCKFCVSPKYFFKKSCIDIPEQNLVNSCLYNNRRAECSKCENYYYLSKDLECIFGKIKGCLLYASESSCEKCEEDSHYLDSNQCFPYSDDLNCSKFDPNQNKCIECPDKHVMKNHKCVDVSKCTQIDDNNNCTKCLNNYYIDQEDKNCHSKTESNCKTPKPEVDQCEKCEDSYFLDESDGFCKKIVGCETLNESKNSCDQCQENYYPNFENSNCIERTATNCKKVHKDQDECLSCIDDYYLDEDNKNCKQVTEIEFCVTLYLESGKCKFCENPKYFDGKKCVDVPSIIENCITYASKTTCETCHEDFFISLDKTECKSGDKEGCLEFTSLEVCKECDPLYNRQSNGMCKKYSDDLDCLDFHPSEDRCNSCELYFKLNLIGKCKLLEGCETLDKKNPTRCTSCAPEYYLDEPNHSCEERSADNCLTTRPNEDQCETCFEDLYFDFGLCRPRNKVHGCTAYHEDDTCENCNSMMYLDPERNICKVVTKPVEKCFVYSSDGQCEVCKSNYVRKWNNKCVIGNIKGCSTYRAPNNCREFYENYFLEKSGENHICINYSKDLNCKTFTVEHSRK